MSELIEAGALPRKETLKHLILELRLVDRGGARRPPKGHPAQVLAAENAALARERDLPLHACAALEALPDGADPAPELLRAHVRLAALSDVEKHYLREEHLLAAGPRRMASVPIRGSRRRAALALAAVAALAAAGEARGESAVSCHCYRDRTFELARPAAADPYVLATTRSSLLSAAYDVPKADLVRTAMTGTEADDLWIAHWGAARLGRTAAAMLEARQEKGTWKAVFRGVEAGKDVDVALAAAEARAAGILRDDARAALARLAVDDVLSSRLGADPAVLATFRAEGASNAETVLAAVLQRHLGAPALPLLRHVRAGGTTWGKLLHECGLTPKDLDGVVRRMVAERRT